MKMKLFVLLFLSAFSAKAELTKTQSQALILARKQGLQFRIQSHEVNRQKFTLVFLGETHVKSAQIFKQEQELIQNFNFRLIEGYGGTGGAPLLKEKLVLGFTQLTFPLWQKATKGQSSSLAPTGLNGFYLHLNGELILNGCPLGLVRETGFYLNEPAADKVATLLPKEQQNDFWKRLEQHSQRAQNLRAQLELDQAQFKPWRMNSCDWLKEVEVSSLKKLTLAFEAGRLDRWKREAVCGDLACLINPWSLPSTRELRMNDYTYHAVQNFSEEKSALILVGRAHVNRLFDLAKTFKEWPDERNLLLKNTQNK